MKPNVVGVRKGTYCALLSRIYHAAALIYSWDPACSDVKARTDPERLRSTGNMTQYVAAFDRLISYIPYMQDDEKVHKLLYRISTSGHAAVAKDIPIDPATKKFWSSYVTLRSYALQQAATDQTLHQHARTDTNHRPASKLRPAGAVTNHELALGKLRQTLGNNQRQHQR